MSVDYVATCAEHHQFVHVGYMGGSFTFGNGGNSLKQEGEKVSVFLSDHPKCTLYFCSMDEAVKNGCKEVEASDGA